MSYDEALRLYFRSDDAYISPALGTKLQPSRGGSERTNADDGWHLRNVNGWLATVYDDGRVEAEDPGPPELDSPEWDAYWLMKLERNRGTMAEEAQQG